MRVHRIIPFTIIIAMLVGACGSTFIVTDAGTDAASDAMMDAALDASSDAQEDYAWWWSQFDARGFEWLKPPNAGEYPSPNGECGSMGGCGPIANCHPLTGWCCSGLDWCCTAANEVLCKCGSKLGCLPPKVCCYLPDAFEPECVPDWDSCPGHRTPWMPGGDDL
jgi:hypothetical protein